MHSKVLLVTVVKMVCPRLILLNIAECLCFVELNLLKLPASESMMNQARIITPNFNVLVLKYAFLFSCIGNSTIINFIVT